MNSSNITFEIKFRFDLQLKLTEMLSISQSNRSGVNQADQRFLRRGPSSPLRFRNSLSPLTNKRMLRHSTPQDLHFLSKLTQVRQNRRPAIDSVCARPPHRLARLVDGAIRKCVHISFKLFKIVDTFGCGSLDRDDQLIVSGADRISLVKENKLLNFKIESHEFKNELQLTDIYYERVQKELAEDAEHVSTKPSHNLSQEFFSTTRELASRRDSVGFGSKREVSVSYFQTPNKPSKKVFSSSMKKIAKFSDPASSFYCKKQQIISAIPGTMKIGSPPQFSSHTHSAHKAPITREQRLLPRSILASVKRILFTGEDVQSESAEGSQESDGLSLQFSTSDALSFVITRNTPTKASSSENGFLQKSESRSQSQKYSWLSLFSKRISQFEKNLKTGLIWTIDCQRKLKVTHGTRALRMDSFFQNSSISACKWIRANLLICGDSTGRLTFGEVADRKLVVVESWQISDGAIRDIRCCRLGVSVACIDSCGRLRVLSLKRLLNSPKKSDSGHVKSDMRMPSEGARVVQCEFHPSKPSILVILKNAPGNEISFFNISTKQTLLRKRFKSAVHCFCLHREHGALFVSQTRRDRHFVSVLQVAPDMDECWRLGRLGLGQSSAPFKNLQMNHSLLVATTVSQKLFIWKQNEPQKLRKSLRESGALLSGNKLFR